MSEFGGWYAGIEGIDTSGKSAQLKLAKEFDQKKGLGTIFTREPGGTVLGDELRELLLTNKDVDLDPDVEFLLFTAGRLHQINTVILPALREDRPVITDRRLESSVAYQSADGRISKEKILKISSDVLPGWYMKPDGLAMLSISMETRRRRLAAKAASEGHDKIESRHDEYFNKVHQEYFDLEKQDYVTAIDGERDPEDVFKDVKPILFGKFAR